MNSFIFKFFLFEDFCLEDFTRSREDKTIWSERPCYTASAMRVFMALSRLGNTERGLSQSALRQLYQSCITTVADFGAEVWWNQQKTQCRPFQWLQNQAMRKIAGAFKTTPIAALEAELGLPPANLRLDRIQRAYATRLLTLPENHPVLELCPDTFPKTLDNERESGVPGKFTPCVTAQGKRHRCLIALCYVRIRSRT